MTQLFSARLFLFFFIALSLPNNTLTMDPPTEEIIPLDTLTSDAVAYNIAITHAAINAQHSLGKKMNQKKMFRILKIIYLHNEEMTTPFIDELRKKNIFFKHIIDHFYQLAKQNLENVTYHTLEIVRDYRRKQPIKELNKLALPLKKYVMRSAYNNIQCLYNIVFEGHTNTIDGTDINISANLAASASADGTFHLWQLSNADYLHTFDEKAVHGYVKFNHDGSQLATATVYCQHPEKTQIKIWDIASKQSLCTIEQQDRITWINFIPDKTDTILLIGKPRCLSLYKLKKNTSPIFMADITDGIRTKPNPNPFGHVKTETDLHSWYVTKNSRRLGLCDYAVNNTDHKKDLVCITQTPIYRELSDYEQTIINTKIAQKLLQHMS